MLYKWFSLILENTTVGSYSTIYFENGFFLDLKKKPDYNIAKKSLMEHQDGLFHVINTSFLPCPPTRKFHSVFSG